MKVVRVTQSSLKRSHFPNSGNIKLPLAPQTLLEVTPKLSLPFQKSDLKEKRGGVLFKWLLPEGYPYSVHDNYFSFTGWTSLQGITSSFIGGKTDYQMLDPFPFLSHIYVYVCSSVNTGNVGYVNENICIGLIHGI